jgi:hypothetical protein
MDTTTSTETVTNQVFWVDAPIAVALIFALAGAFFIGILLLRRRRNRDQ